MDRSNKRSVVNASFRWVEHRPFEVDANDPINACCYSGRDRLRGSEHPRTRTRNEGRHEVRRPISDVALTDSGKLLDRGRVVEERVSATIDLEVDEAGGN